MYILVFQREIFIFPSEIKNKFSKFCLSLLKVRFDFKVIDGICLIYYYTVLCSKDVKSFK